MSAATRIIPPMKSIVSMMSYQSDSAETYTIAMYSNCDIVLWWLDIRFVAIASGHGHFYNCYKRHLDKLLVRTQQSVKISSSTQCIQYHFFQEFVQKVAKLEHAHLCSRSEATGRATAIQSSSCWRMIIAWAAPSRTVSWFTCEGNWLQIWLSAFTSTASVVSIVFIASSPCEAGHRSSSSEARLHMALQALLFWSSWLQEVFRSLWFTYLASWHILVSRRKGLNLVTAVRSGDSSLSGEPFSRSSLCKNLT